jgi:hypothetical protein
MPEVRRLWPPAALQRQNHRRRIELMKPLDRTRGIKAVQWRKRATLTGICVKSLRAQP